MLGNSTSSNDSFYPFTNAHIPVGGECLLSSPSRFVFIAYIITYILLLLPLCIFILHHGLQRWWRKSSTSSVSHCDCFTYHMVVMELVGMFGCVLNSCGVYKKDVTLVVVGVLLVDFTWYRETSFHVLTCVERYLAVVHPITYLSLRNQRGIRIRNITISCVWLLCLVEAGTMMIENLIFVDICTTVSSLILSSFFSLSVLRVLIRPGPGEQGGGRERVDQSKLRASPPILGALVLRLVGGLVWTILHISGDSRRCVIMVCLIWFSLPSSLVLPLLFLHRKGKCVCWEKSIQ